MTPLLYALKQDIAASGLPRSAVQVRISSKSLHHMVQGLGDPDDPIQLIRGIFPGTHIQMDDAVGTWVIEERA